MKHFHSLFIPLAVVAWVALSSSTAGAAVIYYLTLGSDTTGGYTSDGNNTWNSFNGEFFYDSNTNAEILGTSTGAAGLTFERVATGLDATVDFGETNVGDSITYPSRAWFDSSEAGQTNFLSLRNETLSFQLSGLSSSETVKVEWIASRAGSGSRIGDFTVGGVFANSISGAAVSSDDFVTNTDTQQYMAWSGISPDSNGNLVFTAAHTSGSYISAANAIRIEVIPEPSAVALLVACLTICLMFRRRSRNSVF